MNKLIKRLLIIVTAGVLSGSLLFASQNSFTSINDNKKLSFPEKADIDHTIDKIKLAADTNIIDYVVEINSSDTFVVDYSLVFNSTEMLNFEVSNYIPDALTDENIAEPVIIEGDDYSASNELNDNLNSYIPAAIGIVTSVIVLTLFSILLIFISKFIKKKELK